MTKLKLQVASPPTALQESRARKGAPLWRASYPVGTLRVFVLPVLFSPCLDYAIEGPTGRGAHAAETAGPDNFQQPHLTGLGPERRVGVLALGVILIGARLYQKR
jgi:hypothetical protein